MITSEDTEALARLCQDDAPGTVLDRWRSICLGGLIAALVGKGRDITIIVGRRTERKRSQFHVVREEQRQ